MADAARDTGVEFKIASVVADRGIHSYITNYYLSYSRCLPRCAFCPWLLIRLRPRSRTRERHNLSLWAVAASHFGDGGRDDPFPSPQLRGTPEHEREFPSIHQQVENIKWIVNYNFI